MNRKKFIQLSFLGSLGLTLNPWKDRSDYQIIPLPEINKHIRHGNLEQQLANTSSIFPQWIQQIERHTFYKNGFSKSAEDLTVNTIHLNNDLLNISVINNEWLIKSKNNLSYHISTVNKNESYTIDAETKNTFILPLTDHLILNKKSIDLNSGVYFSSINKKHTLLSQEKASFLIINKPLLI